jgi:hypothetical protein
MSSSLLILIGIGAKGQEICYCAPFKYTFTFDFALTCPPVNVTLNEGIADLFCAVTSFGDVADLVPVQVDLVDVLELDQANIPIS